MKLLRKSIRNIILEAIGDSKYQHLATMLDSYDLQTVRPAIEMLVAPDANAGGEPFAEIISHSISMGNSPMAQQRNLRPSAMSTQGPVGKSKLREDPCFHIFKVRFNQPFLDHMQEISPNNMFVQDSVDSYEPTMIFAEKDGETWSDVSAKYNLSRHELSVQVPK